MRSPIFQTVERNGTGRFVVWVYDDWPWFCVSDSRVCRLCLHRRTERPRSFFVVDGRRRKVEIGWRKEAIQSISSQEAASQPQQQQRRRLRRLSDKSSDVFAPKIISGCNFYHTHRQLFLFWFRCRSANSSRSRSRAFRKISLRRQRSSRHAKLRKNTRKKIFTYAHAQD